MDAREWLFNIDGMNAPMTPPGLRQHTIRWTDPAALATAGKRCSGFEFLSAIAAGELPQFPMADLIGFRLCEVRRGEVVFEADVGERHFNPIGSIHGGYAAVLIDSASGCAVFSTIALGDAWTTLHLDVDYLRPMPTAGVVRCMGRVVRVGGTVAVSEAEIVDGSDRVCCRGHSRCLIRRSFAA